MGSSFSLLGSLLTFALCRHRNVGARKEEQRTKCARALVAERETKSFSALKPILFLSSVQGRVRLLVPRTYPVSRAESEAVKGGTTGNKKQFLDSRC